jgi:hypothetical protein
MRVSACVIFPEGESLTEWRASLPEDNIEVVALQITVNPRLKEPVFSEVGAIEGHKVLSWEVPNIEDYFDFSYCRNKLDEYATGEWILHMDSDERLCSPHEDFWGYIDELNESDAEAAMLTIAGTNPEIDENIKYARTRYAGSSMRLKRRASGLKWKSICHEVIDIEKRDSVIGDTDIVLFHYGYSKSQEDIIKKTERNAKLMIREYTREKSDRNWQYLINTFSYLKTKQTR